MKNLDVPITVSVPEYGLIALGLARSGSYEAAKTGIIPVIEVQAKKRVPVRAALSKLAGGDQEVLKSLTEDFAVKYLHWYGPKEERVSNKVQATIRRMVFRPE